MASNHSSVPCPLCAADGSLFLEAQAHPTKRAFYRCPCCRLLYVDPACLPDRELEKSRYLLHRNSRDDAGYLAFIEPCLQAVARSVAPPGPLLDYGSGPQPVPAQVLEERGYRVDCYDPFFSPRLPAVGRRYPGIMALESAEHFHRPDREFARVQGLLAPGGCLVLGTSLFEEGTDLSRWHYSKDCTHVVFYCPATLDWLAERFGWEVTIRSQNLALLCRVS